MTSAVGVGEKVRGLTSPNPWVGCVVLGSDGTQYFGATSPAGGLHAERHALNFAGVAAQGATLFSTLEPCDHQGSTSSCAEAIIEAGVAEVVIGVEDPDERGRGRGVERLCQAGIEVRVGIFADEIEEQLKPYLHHRQTGLPYVVAKMAASLDGRTAAPDGSSQWITSAEARADAHLLRACSDAVIVGAGTVRADNPRLTVRDWQPEDVTRFWSEQASSEVRQPRRIVLGEVPSDAAVQPCESWMGSLPELLEKLGAEGVLQVLVEGGASTIGEFARAGLINRYVIYAAPAVFGGDDGKPLISGAGARTIEDVTRGRFVNVERLGTDVRLEIEIYDAARCR